MVLNENMLVSKEDVSIDTRTLIPRDTYRSRISPYISMFKELIRKGNGTTEIKLRNIREFLGSDFKWKKEYTIYMMLKDILLEFGICTEVRHYYGFNVVMTFAGDNEKIIDSTDIARERRQKMAENAGFKEYRDYLKNTGVGITAMPGVPVKATEPVKTAEPVKATEPVKAAEPPVVAPVTVASVVKAEESVKTAEPPKVEEVVKIDEPEEHIVAEHVEEPAKKLSKKQLKKLAKQKAEKVAELDDWWKSRVQHKKPEVSK
jgi:hypothetical protein